MAPERPFATPHSHPRRPATVCGQDLPASSHICAFFDSRAEQYDVLVPFFREGLEHGEHVVSIFDADMNRGHVSRLSEGGIDVREATRSGQMRVMSTEDSYTLGGVFDGERVYGMVEKIMRDAAASRFPFVRACGEMTWALRHVEANDELVEYEARLNSLVERHQCTVMCTYDVNLFSGQVLMDVLATHPYVLMGQALMVNRYYVPPVQYLQKVLKRRAGSVRRHAMPA